MTKHWLIFILFAFWSPLFSQVWTEEEVIEKALNNHPVIQVANYEMLRRQALEKTAFNPDQPKFTVEFPTDVGPGYEVEQEFDFPTVYSKRKQWLKSQTALASETITLTQRELVRDVRLAFLEAQLAQAQYRFYSTQDSLWREISAKSQRLFDAGEINRADLIYAEKQSGLFRFTLSNAAAEKVKANAVLSSYINEPVQDVGNFRALPYDSATLTETFYFENYLRQSMEVDQNEIEVAQAQRLPDLLIGYLREPEPDTEFRYRYKAGITIPIWQGQYTGEIEAAKANIQKTQAEMQLRQREAKLQQQSWINTLNQGQKNLEWFETTALPQMNQLVDIYNRLYQAGEVDYALMLRNIADAFDVNSQYMEALKKFNQGIIEFDYLNGKK